MKSVFLSNLHHMCAQTDGTYRYPNSREGDMLKQAKKEIEDLTNDNTCLQEKYNITFQALCEINILASEALQKAIDVVDINEK
jgi:hypothetical protein